MNFTEKVRVRLMWQCSDCGARTRTACTCPWKVTVKYNTTLLWARYRGHATYGNFRFGVELTVYAWTEKGAEKRIRRHIRKYQARQARKDTVKEFTIERGKS